MYSFPVALYGSIETNVRGRVFHLCSLCLNHGVDQRKDRRAQTDPESEADRRRNAEPGVFREDSRSEPDVANQMVEEHPVCGFVEPLLYRHSIAEGPAG